MKEHNMKIKACRAGLPTSFLPYPATYLRIYVLSTTKLFTNIYETMYLYLRFHLPKTTKLFTS